MPAFTSGSGLRFVLPPLVVCAALGCADTPETAGGGHIAVAIAPLTYLDASDACYTLTTYDKSYVREKPTLGIVWQQKQICGSQYGDDAEITYIGTCVAGEDNTVTLVLDNLYEGTAHGPKAEGAMSQDEYVNPCPSTAPCVQKAPCKENRDVAITFELTIMRDANQGFFDIAVNFEDIFCSAKIDCQYADGKPIELLFNPRVTPIERDSTAVLAFACTTGDEGKTTLHMDDVLVTCGSGEAARTWRIDPAQEPGNVYSYKDGDKPPTDSPIYQAQITAGTEQLTNLATNKKANKAYWVVALGIDIGRFASADCRVTTAMTASEDGNLLWRSPGTSYPEIAVKLPLTHALGELTCGMHGLDGVLANGTADGVIKTGYSHDEDYQHCLKGDFKTNTTSFCGDVPVYDATPHPLPTNLPSVGFEATSTSEFGDAIDIGKRGTLSALTVTFSAWGKRSEYPNDTRYPAENATWSHPVTVNIYLAGDGSPAGVGRLLGSVTQPVSIPWRPEDTAGCGPGRWSPDGTNCFGGLAFNWTFDLSSLRLAAPGKVVIGIAYNTADYGASPLHVNGPFNSLNVAVGSKATVGGDLDANVAYVNSSNAVGYETPSLGLGVFRADPGWSPYVPAFLLTAR